MDNDLKTVSTKRLKDLRLTYNYTMETLANKIGVSKSTIAKWENGYVNNMRQDMVLKLAKLYDVSPAYIMGYSDDIGIYEEQPSSEETFVTLYSQLSEEQKQLIDNLLTSLVSTK